MTFGTEPVNPPVRALAGDPELFRDVSNRTIVIDHPRDEQTTAMNIQTSITVGHEDLRVVKTLDISTKHGGPHLSQALNCHQRPSRVQLAAYGASVFCHHFSPHDQEQTWGGDDLGAVLDGVRAHLVGDASVADIHLDFADPDAPEEVIAAAAERFGVLHALICNQALSGSDGAVGELSAADLDRHWVVDARASILLAQAFAARHEAGTPASIVFLTSGQGSGPMPGEVAYAAAKAAIAGVTTTIADQLADRGIRVNTINPGPVDTGYLNDQMWRMIEPMFPFGRVGRPDDPARLIAWLVTEEASWITGQIINTEGGFGRWRPRGA